ncbi:choice-of-anchor D domain-containing protein [Flavobacterium sp.]|uniref:choice-of-anchor D domain-containing protein n=1 Tax=Flavobacterium sp. TaxID=239 RepID=UPI00286D9C86|nr:choice-of-anchor D domain-containing protein [Flavobacterium sp.]
MSLVGLAQSSQTYNTAGTYTFTVPTGIISIDIEVWGAGGAGGGATANNSAGGGGAGGGYVKKVAMSVTPGSTYTVTVGAGGTGGATNGGTGNASWFGSAATIFAIGGNGGNLGNTSNTSANGASASSSGNIGFTAPFSYYGGAGGKGTSGTPSSSGAGGSSAGRNANGNAPIGINGGVAPTGGGNGAVGSTINGNGANGLTPGGGGAGAVRSSTKNKSGGFGASGQVVVSWACPAYSLNATPTVLPACTTFAATVTAKGTATGLPVGTYTVTYTLSGANIAASNTAQMTVSTAGTGTFNTTVLSNAGNTTITITNIASLTCGNVIATNNVVVANVGATPTITSTTPNSRTGTGTVSLIAASSAGSVKWYDSAIGGTLLITNTNYTTPSISATTSYYVEATNGACTSSPRVEVVATINTAEIAVSGNGINIADGETTPSSTDDTDLGGTNLQIPLVKTYTINNLGGAPLTVGTATITGANASEFVIVGGALPPSIPAQSSATFSISFTPTSTGNRTANISFTNNDSDENPFNFNIAGTGLAGVSPEINLRVTNDIPDGASSGVSTTGVVYGTDFGSTPVGTPIVKTITIQNTGTGILTLTGTPKVVITGDAVFTVTAQPSTTIAAGGNTTFQVTFNSAVTGNFLAIISIANDDSDESLYDFVISGKTTVSGSEIDIQGNDVTIADGDTTPSALDQTDFGSTDTTTKIAIPYHILNYGTSSLGITTTVSITGPNASFFTASPVLTSSLGSGGITSFVVTFTPTTAVGIKTATITVTNTETALPLETSYDFAVSAEIKNPVALTVAPGGVTSNLKYWIKADSNIGSTADNTDITNWQDRTTGSTKNAIAKLGKEPKFFNNTTNNVNFNPVVQFNGANAMAGGQGFNNLDMFIVVKPTKTVNYLTSPMDTYCGDDITSNKNNQDVTGFEMGNTSSRYSNEIIAYNQAAFTAYGVGEISTTKSYTGVNIFNPRNNGTRMSIFNNGGTLNNGTGALATIEVNTATYKNIVNSRYWLGASETFGPSYDGDILEIINYSLANSLTDRRRIESYLAIKYGITLGVNGSSLDYYSSASTNTGSSIYAAGSGFNYNIAGIGRDDASQLYQKQSKTENTKDDITIGLGDIYDKNSDNPNTFVSDKNFLVWGSDNGSLLAKPEVVVNMSSGIAPSLTSVVNFISIRRTWKVVETGGNIPSVKVSVPSTLLTSTITPPGDFLMFISDSPVFNPTSEYRIMRVNGSKLETDFDFDGTKYITFGYAPEKIYERCINFDGINDYLDSGKVLDLNTSFTVSAWVKSSAINKTILSKRDKDFTAGYDLSINSVGKVEMSWINGAKQSITSTMVLPQGIWHNVGVTYDGATARLYIDGVEDASVALLNVPANPTLSFLIAAADGIAANTTSFFNGNIDEVRVWKVALSEKQLRYVMNQEILSNGLATNGKTMPNTITLNDISIIPWSNLSAYYPMSTYTFTNAQDASNNRYTAALRNLTTVDYQTAPLPYKTANDGPWQTPSTWLNSSVQDLPNSVSLSDNLINVDWNIVETSHNVTSTGNKSVLGLMVKSNTLSAFNDTKIQISNYLKLDGKIDLVGLSQLVQTKDCDLDVTSNGSIEREQQGQANKYNYNYWCSPVSPINNFSNNNNYTLAGVMKDGFNTTPREINWIAGYDGIAGSVSTPMSIAKNWLYTFDDKANAYANWNKITETTPIRVGQGFTMKGSGVAGTQNYIFTGKPNNGAINSNTVLSDQLLLTGNPYPSALDADAFINDNLTSTDGTIYFWEHYSTNNTHVLRDYQGGYGTLNLVGGIASGGIASSIELNISNLGSSSKGDPKQYIPVGQGFFVNGSATGGTVIFNNQRAFLKETDSNSNSMFKNRPESKRHKTDHWHDNSNDELPNYRYKKIRLGFSTSNQYHRQILLGFMNEKASSEMDSGYDAFNLDETPNDMYFLNGENELVIQGEGYFNEDNSYPIGVKTDAEGKVSFTIDALENFEPEQKIYLYDDVTKISTEIQKNTFEVNLPAGVNNTRFSLRFKDNSASLLGIEENKTNANEIKIAHIQNSNTIIIKNTISDISISKVTLFSINGQAIANWKIENQDQQNIQIPIKSISSGVYVVKLKTTTGELSKKLIVK